MDLSKEFEKQKRIKVAISIPHTGWIVGGLETKITHWIMESDYDVIQIFKSAKPTVSNRNLIAIDFLETDADFLLTIDSDTVPTVNPLKLIEHDLDIVGGVYPAWKETGYIWLAVNKQRDGSFKHVKKNNRNGLVEVDALGAGCMLIKRKVLEDIKCPFLDKIDPVVGNRSLGHDLYFCERAKEKGFKVYADWDVICDHYKEIPLIPVVNAIEEAYEKGYKTGKKEKY